MASAVASAGGSANAQHNLLALQTQLQALQLENATLTKALTLRDNYLLQKEQQLRVLQQRLDDLEGGVARWKDRYLQQLQANDAATAALAAAAGNSHDAADDSAWRAMALPAARGGTLPDADAMGALVDKLTTADRERLKKLLGAERTRTQLAPWEESFADASPELQRVLLQYLMPVLLETQRLAHHRGEPAMAVQCLTREYRKRATDFRIVCQRGTAAGAAGTSASASTAVPSDGDVARQVDEPVSSAAVASVLATDGVASSSSHRGSYGSESSTTAASTPPTSTRGTTSLATAAAAASERLAAEDAHLFDCVDCEVAKRNASAAAVPHGPREIHATKAVYISRPLPSFKHSHSGTEVSTAFSDADSDRRSGASSNSLTGSVPGQSGKIKKIMGSVMKGLNRHKTSSSHPPPPPHQQPPQYPMLSTPNTMPGDGDTDGGDDSGDASICDGCGRGLLTGVKWICRTCRLHKDQEFALCEKCYGQGLHGKENEDALFERIEEIVVAKCPKLAREQELMKLLRVGICKANLKKYSFCLTWIADLLLCKATKDLRARALEISQISPHVRSEFVRVLTELLTKHRRDIELITEWQPVENVSAPAGGTGSDGTGMLQLDTLRIWVKDAVVDASAAAGQQ